ncbi:T-cell receptor-associated transmembrane adapter 1 [Lates calcarifer]|uniref:T-cell receptor-associated transmembrane adapter 1 n=1 Tax=Lates calcarifer TaxID=8187 RepID=UPI000874B0C4|nr:T-cell receptor-associated transmembrane adapter 1 [Lates calcarifer]
MSSCCNGTSPNGFLCSVNHVWMVFGAIGMVLFISLSWNIFCCVSKCYSGKGTCRRRRQSPRQMEDNPIYGNISYTQTSMTLYTESDRPHSSLSSSSLRDQHRVNSNSQSKAQDCYANLTLKPPRPQSGRSSPQIQYSDVVQLEVQPESEKEDEGHTDTVSTMSDLYASVQTQRTKTVDLADTGEDYANHL